MKRWAFKHYIIKVNTLSSLAPSSMPNLKNQKSTIKSQIDPIDIKLMLSALKASIFHAFFSALKVKCFQPNFARFFRLFFTSSENATKSKFRQETLNILTGLKFKGSHLAFYE
jgi:hypothetical protein